MYSLEQPLWFNNFMRSTRGNELPGIFLYMQNAVMWTTVDALTDLIRTCTTNKALKQQITDTIATYVYSIKKEANNEEAAIKASLTWMSNISGQLVLRICENVQRPKTIYAFVFEITPEGNFERIVRSFSLSESTFTKKKR